MTNPILEVRNVSKNYAAHKALKDVSIIVPSGSIYGLLGPNGAGKTSLIRIITQITGADTGEVLFKGEHLQPKHIYQIGYLPEERGLYRKMEVGEQLLYFAQLKGLSRSDAHQKLKSWVEKFEIKSWWNKKVEELSKGMQQKIQFIATVLHEPELIILDEPFSGFDPINANLVTEEILKLRDNGCSIIFSTHRMESVEQLCDHIALINKSTKVLEGSVKDIRKQYKTNSFEVQFSGNETFSIPDFNLVSSKVVDTETVALYSLSQGQLPNDLLKELMTKVQVNSFRELVPDMQEIFIQVVSGN